MGHNSRDQQGQYEAGKEPARAHRQRRGQGQPQPAHRQDGNERRPAGFGSRVRRRFFLARQRVRALLHAACYHTPCAHGPARHADDCPSRRTGPRESLRGALTGRREPAQGNHRPTSQTSGRQAPLAYTGDTEETGPTSTVGRGRRGPHVWPHNAHNGAYGFDVAVYRRTPSNSRQACTQRTWPTNGERGLYSAFVERIPRLRHLTPPTCTRLAFTTMTRHL